MHLEELGRLPEAHHVPGSGSGSPGGHCTGGWAIMASWFKDLVGKEEPPPPGLGLDGVLGVLVILEPGHDRGQVGPGDMVGIEMRFQVTYDEVAVTS